MWLTQKHGFLLCAGASVNSQENYNRDTPAHIAARKEHQARSLLDLLVGYGADLTILNRYDERPLDDV